MVLLLRRLTRFLLFLTASLLSAQTGTPRWNVILISIDTLRADRLGVAGYAKASSPNLDRLAREGVWFDRVFTPAPLTLPAHTSLLTSLYPPSHGVRDNAQALSASVPTLAEQFHTRGYKTGAFIGAFVLDRRFGLARGFDTYQGEFPLHRFAGADPGDVQIRGDQVEAAAEKWIVENNKSPFFAFVHFYDLHGPYLLPAAWRARFPGRIYDGEIAYVDSLIGTLWTKLQQTGLAARTLLVITADHGEGLGDHGERNHGFLLYRSTTQVPLIIRFPDASRKGTRVSGVASLIDVAPTLCAIAGVPPAKSFQGRNLLGSAGAAAAAYSETLYGFRHFHTSPMYSYRNDKHDYILAPRPELYVMADAREQHDLAPADPKTADGIRAQLASLVSGLPQAAPTTTAVPPEVAQKLRSLGYVSGSSNARHAAFPPIAGADPKDRIALFGRYQDALEKGSAAELDKITAEDPALIGAQIETGLAWQRLGNEERAIEHFRAALAAEPENALAHYDLGVSLSKLNRFPQAEQELDVAIGLEPWSSRPYVARGLAQAHMGKMKEAIESLSQAITIDAGDFDAWMNRGAIYGTVGDMAHARADLEKAAAIEPGNGAVHQALGTLAFHTGDTARALEEYRLAVKASPNSSTMHSDLGLLYLRLQRGADAAAEFKAALALDPNNRDAAEGLRRAR